MDFSKVEVNILYVKKIKKSVVTRIYIFDTPFSSGQPLFMEKWYNFITENDSNELLASMNYGYVDSLSDDNTPVSPQLRLYEHVIEDADLRNKVVLEVGAGRVAGASYLFKKRHLPFMLPWIWYLMPVKNQSRQVTSLVYLPFPECSCHSCQAHFC